MDNLNKHLKRAGRALFNRLNFQKPVITTDSPSSEAPAKELLIAAETPSILNDASSPLSETPDTLILGLNPEEVRPLAEVSNATSETPDISTCQPPVHSEEPAPSTNAPSSSIESATTEDKDLSEPTTSLCDSENQVITTEINTPITRIALPANFHKLKNGMAIRVLFIAQHPSIWATWRSIWHAMTNNPEFIAKVVLSPFFHPYSSTVITMDNMRQCLIEENVPFCTFEALNLDSFLPHVVFLQNPYDETRPEFLRSDHLSQQGSRIAYVPYGLEMGGGAWNIKAQFDLPLHRAAWRIFARSERHKKMYAKYCQSGNSHIVVTGHPKFDKINYSSPKALPQQIINKAGDRKVILWTPHFSVTKIPSWSTYQLYSSGIFSLFEKQQDMFLLLRPHPLFFKSLLQNGFWTKEDEEEFKKTIETSLNIAIDDSADYHPAFEFSDALMTDVGSFLLEYLPTGKPLLYMHHPDGLGMNDDGELTKLLYTAMADEDIADFIKLIKNGRDPKLEERKSAISTYLSGLDRNIGVAICDEIRSSLRAGDAWYPQIREDKLTPQQRSEQYWSSATTTYLAPPNYYERKKIILDEELAKLPTFISAIDIGCGDGKFTLQLSKYVERIQAFDISSELIEQARLNAIKESANNVSFIQQEIDAISPFERFDLVSCLGVTSCIIDDSKFVFFIQKLRALCKSGGYLLMIDTVSTTDEQNAEDQSGYVAKYRSIADYSLLLKRAGFTSTKEIVITEVSDRSLVNKLFILQPTES